MTSEKIETINAKIAETETEIRQLENRAKRLTQAHSQLERKARTHRLIQRGAKRNWNCAYNNTCRSRGSNCCLR